MNVQPYLMFNGRAEEAIDFYRTALDAEVTALMRFGDAPEAPPPGMIPDGWDHKIMHASFRVGEAELMASDGCQSDGAGFSGVSLSLSVATVAEAEARFAALSEGGKVTMPLGPTFFASSFGMLTDRFGVSWMIVYSKM